MSNGHVKFSLQLINPNELPYQIVNHLISVSSSVKRAATLLCPATREVALSFKNYTNPAVKRQTPVKIHKWSASPTSLLTPILPTQFIHEVIYSFLEVEVVVY